MLHCEFEILWFIMKCVCHYDCRGIVKKKIETCLSADGRSREIHLLFDTLQKHKIFEVLFIYHKS